MTIETIIQRLNEGESKSQLASELGVCRTTLRKWIAKYQAGGKVEVQQSKVVVAPTDTEGPSTAAKGVTLHNLRVVPSKPNISPIRVKIRRLPEGRGFTPEELSEEWGDTPEKIADTAKKMRCRKAVEVHPDEWVWMVMNPETAKQFQ